MTMISINYDTGKMLTAALSSENTKSDPDEIVLPPTGYVEANVDEF